MITTLNIKNVGIIDDLSIDFNEGFNVLTGETGAGKTLLIGSLAILAGGRFSKEMIRKDENYCYIEANFYLPENSLAIDGNIIVSREIHANGRNSCKINGRLVTVTELKEVMNQIMDIHGQHDNQLLLNPTTHIQYLDRFIGSELEGKKSEYLVLLEEYNKIKKEIKENYGEEQEKERRLDLLNYQLNEINNAKLNVVSPRDIIKLSHMEVEFIKNNHSIPDACSIAVHTDQGIIYHTGDFKIDLTPVDGEVMDIHRICELSKKGVLLLLADSTNAEQPGSTISEKAVGAGLDDLFRKASNSRIIVATFASNIHRLQQIINTAEKLNRKVAVSGRSMVNVVAVATELGYLNIPENMLIDLNDISKYEDSEVVIITTGSQGEPMSALARMASAEHKKVEIKRGDLVIISAHTIPGNEKLISKVINSLFEKGAEVVYDESDIHASGHAKQEELKLIHRLVRPKFFMPAHGEHRMLKIHAELAEELGMPSQNIFVNKTGDVLEIDRNSAKVTGTIPTGNVLVDGLGVGDVGNIVLRDRKHLSEDGLMIVVVTISKEDGRVLAGPDIISRGFVYVRESEDLMDGAKNVIKDVLRDCEDRNIKEWAYLKNNIKENLKEYLYQKTKRNPMILPIIMEV